MRKDITLSFFEQRTPDSIETVMPVDATGTHRTRIQGPGWNRREGSTSWEHFAETVIASPKDATFFLDASFLHRHQIPEEVFAAMLSRRIAVTPLIWTELQDWVKNPFANSGFRDVLVEAHRRGNPAVLFLDLNDWPSEIRDSVRYYVSLLLVRKRLGLGYKAEYENAHGREMSDAELTSKLQTAAGDRGVMLAKKGLLDNGKPNFEADEDLVVSAVTYAILTGAETSLLTRDRDPLEQFRKVLWLIDTHYRCHLIAQSFLSSPENLIEFTDGTGAQTPNDVVETGDRSMLRLPRRFTDWVLPRPGHPVMVHCHRIAGEGERMKFASLDFCAQREMASLLLVKGKTGGRNYELPDGKNCHLAVSPPFLPEMNGLAIIGRDRVRRLGDFSGPLVDLEYAIREVQRIRRTEIDFSTCQVPKGTPGEILADFSLLKRLAFASDPWESLEWKELATGIRFFDAAALFFVDRGVVPRLRADARHALIERGFRWSTSTRNSALAVECADFSAAERKALNEMGTFAPRPEPAHEYGFGYYVFLLSLRKQISTIIRQRVRNEYGRECRNGEVEEIAEYYGGQSARRFARNCDSHQDDPLFFAGDEVLVHGALLSILEGSDVVFLTRDPLFLDQFAMLCGLLGQDYVASQYGRRFAHDPSALSFKDTFTSFPKAAELIFGKVSGGKPIHGWQDGILPRNPYLINLHCWLFGSDDGNSVRFATGTFCAERGMHNLLRIKGATGGRNVEGLDGRNVRAAFSEENGEDCVVTIWNDRMIRAGAPDFPVDSRLNLGVAALAAADISRVYNNQEKYFVLPWHEAGE